MKIRGITAAIKKCQSIIKKKKKKNGKIILPGKTKLNRSLSTNLNKINSIEVPNSKALYHSYISHDKFVLINNALKEYHAMKEEIKNLKT